MKTLIAVLLLLIFIPPGGVCASQNIYGSDGQRVGVKSRDGGSTTYYDRDGRRSGTERNYDNRRDSDRGKRGKRRD